MEALSLITAVLLLGIAAMHFYWAFGGKWGLDKVLPTKEGTLLITPGSALTATVGMLLLIFAYVACALHCIPDVPAYVIYTGWGISLLFALRAVGDFNAVGFFKKIKATPFALYDTRLYSPLCLGLGSAFALLAYRA